MTNKLLKSAKEVYSMLEDEHSKQVFLNRLSYIVTGDLEYFKKMPGAEELNDKTLGTLVFMSPGLKEKINSSPDKLVIYGAGAFGKRIYSILLDNKIEVFCFWDKNADNYSDGYYGKKVLKPIPTGDEKILIGSVDYENEMIDYLLSIGVERDKIILFDRNEFHFDKSGQYFDSDIIRFSDNEIFIDAGVFDLYTSENLLKKCSTVKKIYAFEPNEMPFNLEDFKQRNRGFDNIEIIKAGLWSKNDVLKFSPDGPTSQIPENGNVEINVVALDEAVDDEVSFIKMDIQGAELEALKGAERTIKKYNPKLAISVYHKPEDIIDIPLYIKSIAPGYRFYMRHYTSIHTETVLYAVV